MENHDMSPAVEQFDSSSDRRLVGLLIDNDEEAWKCVIGETILPYISRHKQGIGSLLEEYSIQPESVVSQVYLSLMKNEAAVLRKFRFECKFSTYAYMWVLDAVQSEIRRVCDKRVEPLKLYDEFPVGNVIEGVQTHESLEQSQGLLLSLFNKNPIYYCVLCYRVILNKTSKETAVALHKSVANVDQLLHRAQAVLRKKREKFHSAEVSTGSIYQSHRKREQFVNNIRENKRINMNTMNQKINWRQPGNSRPRICMLMITHACNLNCTYCYESFKSGRKMPSALAKEIILREVEFVKQNSKYDGLEIDLMGGEPMMNYPLIQELVEWAESGAIDIPYIFFITSNGTLFDDERKAWFEAHKRNIVVGVSYDGTTEMQRKNRKTDDYRIDREFFHNTWPFQEFHMTISKETLPHLAEGILEMQRKGYPLNAALAQGVEWNDDDARLYDEQLLLLSREYLKAPEMSPINILGIPNAVCLSSEVEKDEQPRWCGSGTDMITYDVDGRAYGCHMYSSVVLGNKAQPLAETQMACAGGNEDEYCSRCILKACCPTCAGFNYRYRGDSTKRDHRWCKMVFVQIKRACEFQIKMISTHLQQLDKYDAVLAESALRSFPILNKVDIFNQSSPFIVNSVE